MIGTPCGQGYYFSKPMSGSELDDYLVKEIFPAITILADDIKSTAIDSIISVEKDETYCPTTLLLQ